VKRTFNLNENKIELISALRPKQQLHIKTPKLSKAANLKVVAKSSWFCTNEPFDNLKRREAFETYRFEKGCEVLASSEGIDTIAIRQPASLLRTGATGPTGEAGRNEWR
jgi:hypothetical protein